MPSVGSRLEGARPRPVLAHIVKVGVSLGLIGVIIAKTPIEEVAGVFDLANWRLVCVAWVLFLGVNCLASLKWKLLLSAQGLPLTYTQATATYFIGLFFNNFLPTGFGGDTVRAYRVARQTQSKIDGLVAVGFDRLHSSWALLIVAVPCTVYSAASLGLPRSLVVVLAATMVATGAMALFTILSPRPLRLFLAMTGHLPQPVAGKLLRMLQALRGLGSHKPVLFLSSLIAITYQLLGIAVHYLLSSALGVPVDFITLAAVSGLASLVSVLPVSINGLGLREGSYVVLLGGAGVAAPSAVSLALLSFVVLSMSSLVGGVVFILDGQMTRRRRFPGPQD